MALAGADEVVGYGLYLDLVEGLIAGKPRHGSELGEEEARARIALDLAAEGKSVALVCSGDPGIYALATLVFELLDRESRPDWNRVEVTVVPGISALQAAAARAGAPLGHDFCAISLSDLLTPKETILKRLKAAAEPISSSPSTTRKANPPRTAAPAPTDHRRRPPPRNPGNPRPQPRPRRRDGHHHHPLGIRYRIRRHADPRNDRQQPDPRYICRLRLHTAGIF